MTASDDEAIRIFSDLVNTFETLQYHGSEPTKINGLLQQTQDAIRLTFGEDSEYFREFRQIKIIRPHAKARNIVMYFEQDRHRAIGILNRILVRLRLTKMQQHPEDDTQDHHGQTTVSVIETRPGFVFIAMPMSPEDHSLEDVHEAIKETARAVGLHAQRTDDIPTNERITDRILELIQSAEYVVADLTHSRPNVYWEAGYAHALGKIPIYIARDGTNIEFDLKDYPIIFFRNLAHLKRELSKRLEALKAS